MSLLTSFIFEKYRPEEFYQLDGWIERYTQSVDGYIGMESYTDAASGRMVNNYCGRPRINGLLINNFTAPAGGNHKVIVAFRLNDYCRNSGVP